MRRLALTAFSALGIGTLLLLAGCPANLDDPQRFEGTSTPSGGTGAAVGGTGAGGGVAVPVAPAAVTAAFAKTCGTTSCHDGTASSDLDLIAPGVATRLINVTAGHMGIANPSACPPAKFIDTSNTAASWLLVKLMGTQPATCGSPMPLVGSLSASDQTAITNWVNSLGASGSTSGGGGSSAGGSGGSTAVGGGGPAAGGSGGASGGGA